MLFGVICFSYATGVLSSILQNIDSSKLIFKEKMMTLNQIKNDYDKEIDEKLYNKMIAAIKYESRKTKRDPSQFIDSLPKKLSDELSLKIHKELTDHIVFFDKFGNNVKFLNSIGFKLKPIYIEDGQFVYKEHRNLIDNIYFVNSGTLGYVLLSYK